MQYLKERKQYLDQLLTGTLKPSHKPLKACTLVGRPKAELVQSYREGRCDYEKWMNSHQIPFEKGAYDSTSVTFYFPQIATLFLEDELYVVIKDPTLEQVNQVIETTFDELLDVYEVGLPPMFVNQLVGMMPKDAQTMTFDKLLFLLREYTQSEIATLVQRSSQTICDLKKGRMKLSLEIVQSLMREFPLLPWQSLILLLDLN